MKGGLKGALEGETEGTLERVDLKVCSVAG